MSLFIDQEALIVEKLIVDLDTLNSRVYYGKDLENAMDKALAGTSVFVAYSGIVSVLPLPNAAHIAKATLQYTIWIVGRSATLHGSGQGSRSEVDPVATSVITSIMGWKASKELTPLVLAQSQDISYADGFAFFPLAFTSHTTLRGANS